MVTRPLKKKCEKTAIFKEAFCPKIFQSHECALTFCQVCIWTSSMPKISDVTQKLSEKWLFKGAAIQEIFRFRNSKFSFFCTVFHSFSLSQIESTSCAQQMYIWFCLRQLAPELGSLGMKIIYPLDKKKDAPIYWLIKCI